MAFWNRNKEESEDKDEDYYMDEKDDSRSTLTSFVFGVTALLITILIATAVVFGVRAIYRAIHGNNSSTTATVTGSNGSTGENSAGKSGQSSGGSSSNKTQSQNTSGHSPSTTPSTGDNVPLPKTGDPGM